MYSNKIRHTRSQKGFHSLLLAVTLLFCFGASSWAELANSISQHGITWTFKEKHETGQFANGDHWVVGPVKIIGIDPPSIERVGTTSLSGFVDGGDDAQPRTMNGSMANPVPPVEGVPGAQGFDSEMYLWHPINGRYPNKQSKYDSTLNVALGVTAESALELPADSSLVSTISHEQGGRPQLKSAAILTVLGAVPPDKGATIFRPPYVGTSKPLISTKGLRKDLLPQLPLVHPMPDLDDVIAQFDRPWLDHFAHVGDGTQYTSPSENMPNYGREYSQAVGKASLMLMLNEKELLSSNGQTKDDLLIRFVQLGIDLYYVTENGGYWWGVGGLNHGRKWPIIFAGLMLDNESMRTIGSRSKEMPYWGFAEDAQTKYIEESDVAMSHSSAWKPDDRGGELVPYETSDIGMPEWNVAGYAPGHDGARAANKPFGHLYREINGMSYPGIILAALLLNQKGAWNHDALFDYTDRYVPWAIEQKASEWNEAQKSIYVYGGDFQRAMWEAYRGDKDDKPNKK